MNNYIDGDWNVICDICGKKRKYSQCKKTWDGYLACTVENCWYPKHPFDMPIPIIQDDIAVPEASPRADITYLNAEQGVSIWGSTIETSSNWSSTVSWAEWDVTWDFTSVTTLDIPLR